MQGFRIPGSGFQVVGFRVSRFYFSNQLHQRYGLAYARATEQAAVKATTAALEIQEGLRRQQGESSGAEQTGCQFRVGINTGELVIGHDDADLVGDVLNTAARLEAACRPGRVMVGEDTWRLTRSTIRYETLGQIELKGKSDVERAVAEQKASTARYLGVDRGLHGSGHAGAHGPVVRPPPVRGRGVG